MDEAAAAKGVDTAVGGKCADGKVVDGEGWSIIARCNISIAEFMFALFIFIAAVVRPRQ